MNLKWLAYQTDACAYFSIGERVTYRIYAHDAKYIAFANLKEIGIFENLSDAQQYCEARTKKL